MSYGPWVVSFPDHVVGPVLGCAPRTWEVSGREVRVRAASREDAVLTAARALHVGGTVPPFVSLLRETAAMVTDARPFVLVEDR
jgi:hypothetical protein